MSRRGSIARARSCCSLCQWKSSQRDDCKRRRKRGWIRRGAIYCSFARGGIDQEGIFIAVLLFAQFNVLVVLHSNRLYDARSLSQSRSLCTLVVCKFKFLTYHLRDNFLGVYRKIIAIGSFRFFWIYAFLRDRLFGLLRGHQVAIASVVDVSLCNLQFVYSFSFPPSRGVVLADTHVASSLINYNYIIIFFQVKIKSKSTEICRVVQNTRKYLFLFF